MTRIDSVDGMMNAAPTPIARPAGDELPHLGRRGRGQRSADEEDDEAELQRALAPEAVAERAGREQQAGEHERVDGDRPTAAASSVASSSRDSVGMATLRLELPTKTISRLRQSTASVHQRRRVDRRDRRRAAPAHRGSDRWAHPGRSDLGWRDRARWSPSRPPGAAEPGLDVDGPERTRGRRPARRPVAPASSVSGLGMQKRQHGSPMAPRARREQQGGTRARRRRTGS